MGLVAAVVGLVDGIVMALDKKEAPCPDGTYFPEGATDITCYVHPEADIGIAVASISVVLGILVVLASTIARAHLASASDTGAGTSPG